MAASGAGNRLRQVILPTRACEVMGATIGIARRVKTKIGIADNVDKETCGEFESNLLRGA